MKGSSEFSGDTLFHAVSNDHIRAYDECFQNITYHRYVTAIASMFQKWAEFYHHDYL